MDNPPQGWPAWILLCTFFYASSSSHPCLFFIFWPISLVSKDQSSKLQNVGPSLKKDRVFCASRWKHPQILNEVRDSVSASSGSNYQLPLGVPRQIQNFLRFFFPFFNLNFSQKFQNVRPSLEKPSFPRVKTGFSSSSSSWSLWPCRCVLWINFQSRLPLWTVLQSKAAGPVPDPFEVYSVAPPPRCPRNSNLSNHRR